MAGVSSGAAGSKAARGSGLGGSAAGSDFSRTPAVLNPEPAGEHYFRFQGVLAGNIDRNAVAGVTASASPSASLQLKHWVS